MTNQDELKLAHSGAWSDDEIKRLENYGCLWLHQ